MLIIAAVSAYTGRWLRDNKGNIPLLRSWGPFGPRVPTYIDLCTRPSSTQQSYLSAAVSAHWGRRLREQSGFLRHGREEKAVTKGLGTDIWTPIVPALCLPGFSRRVVLLDDYGGYSQASVLCELWPVNCAIRCRLRHDDGTMQAPSGARLPSVAPSRCACTMGRGSDPALFPWTGVHSLGSSL